MLDNNGLGKEINETVEKAFCWLSGSEPPLFPSLSIEGQAEKEQEDLNSSSKKRSFSKMSVDGGADEVVDLFRNYPAMPEDRNPLPSSSGQMWRHDSLCQMSSFLTVINNFFMGFEQILLGAL